jgi:hypothetical protein
MKRARSGFFIQERQRNTEDPYRYAAAKHEVYGL